MTLSKIFTSFPSREGLGMGLLSFICFLLAVPCFASQPLERWLQGYQKVLVIGAHPDDPESMCAGTALKLKNAGAEVVMVYFTSGEGGITGATEQEARDIRRAEALQACQVLGMRAVFMTQVDGRSEINQARYDEMKALIEAHGGKNSGSVSGKTTYLLAGEKSGPEKMKKAQTLGVKVISEEDLYRMLEE